MRTFLTYSDAHKNLQPAPALLTSGDPPARHLTLKREISSYARLDERPRHDARGGDFHRASDCGAGNGRGQQATATTEDFGRHQRGLGEDRCRSSPKYSQPLLDTPQTITVIPASVIRDRAASTLRDVLRNSPGITFQAGEGGGGLPGDQNFSMRGTSARNSLFIDGVRDVGSYTRDSFNLQQVELIKGPTGTMAGRSATSGAINQVAKTPSLEDSQEYSLGYGSDDYKRVTSDINVGLGDSMAFRMNAMYHDAEVSRRDVVENERWGIAPSFALGLGTRTRFTASALYVDEDNVPDYGLPWGTLTQTTATDPSHNGSFPTGAYDANPSVDQSNFYGLKNYDYEDIETKSGTLQLEHDFNESITARNVLRYLDSERSSAITAPRPPNRQLQRRDMQTENITNLTDVTIDFATGSVEHSLVFGTHARDDQQPQQREHD